ncbi:MAG TPA: hypothetical protein VFK02_17380 [Kofleriaceae bacterium]|nr:hypothetical protein [Kofleriaceae bacterium]
MTNRTDPDRDRPAHTDALRDLLERAFWSARVTGKRDWNRMIVAVLKNRLLQLTNRSFREEDFGASSLLELVARHADLVAVDRSVKPVVVEWVGTPAPPRSDARVGRVRPDLWRAVLDFSSGLEYEWDARSRQARPVESADPANRMPTVDAGVLAAWRTSFIETYGSTLTTDEDRERLRAWADRALGSQGLPRTLRAPWNEYLKQAVVARLTAWFQASGRPLPDLTAV